MPAAKLDEIERIVNRMRVEDHLERVVSFVEVNALTKTLREFGRTQSTLTLKS